MIKILNKGISFHLPMEPIYTGSARGAFYSDLSTAAISVRLFIRRKESYG